MKLAIHFPNRDCNHSVPFREPASVWMNSVSHCHPRRVEASCGAKAKSRKCCGEHMISLAVFPLQAGFYALTAQSSCTSHQMQWGAWSGLVWSTPWGGCQMCLRLPVWWWWWGAPLQGVGPWALSALGWLGWDLAVLRCQVSSVYEASWYSSISKGTSFIQDVQEGARVQGPTWQQHWARLEKDVCFYSWNVEA